MSNFVLNGLAGQGPTTRTYDFVVTEATGSPDGFDRPMLVVNGKELCSRTRDVRLIIYTGMYPGPTIEANQHDTLVVKVTNNMPNRTCVLQELILNNILTFRVIQDDSLARHCKNNRRHSEMFT